MGSMVNVSSIDQVFTQQCNSCVLASYGIVTKFFRGSIGVQDVFEQYCDHFKIPYFSTLDSERSSSNHLNLYCNHILKWSGYQLVSYLHNHAYNNIFWVNRGIFSAEIFSLTPLPPYENENLIRYLREHESLANFATSESAGFHSRTIGVGADNRIFVHNTALNGENKLSYPSESQLPLIQECILYSRR